MTDRARELLERVRPWSLYLPLNLRGDILEYLSTPEPEQDEEPVAWTNQDELNALGTDVTCYMYAEPLIGETNIPLYLHPAPRKPFVRLSDEEIDRELIKNDYYSRSFTAGVRFAEKHHGILGEE